MVKYSCTSLTIDESTVSSFCLVCTKLPHPTPHTISCTHRKEVQVKKSRWQFLARVHEIGLCPELTYQPDAYFFPISCSLGNSVQVARNGMSRKIYQTSGLKDPARTRHLRGYGTRTT